MNGSDLSATDDWKPTELAFALAALEKVSRRADAQAREIHRLTARADGLDGQLTELRATHSAALADPRPGIPCEPDPADITATEDRARGAVVNCRGWGCNRDECTTCAAIRDYYERLDGESDTVPSLRREIARVTTELDRCRKRLADLADELVRQRPLIDAALAFHGCGTKNVNARIDDVLTAGLTYMQGEPDA